MPAQISSDQFNRLQSEMAHEMNEVEKHLGRMYRKCHDAGKAALTMPILCAWDGVDKALDVLDKAGGEERQNPMEDDGTGAQLLSQLMQIVDGCTALIGSLPHTHEHMDAVNELRHARTHVGKVYQIIQRSAGVPDHCTDCMDEADDAE